MIIYEVLFVNSKHQFDLLINAEEFCTANSVDFENITESEKEEVPESKMLGTVSAKQLRQAIVLSGMTMAQVDAILDSLDEPSKTLAKIAWEFSTKFERDDELVDFVASSIGITTEQTNDLWKLAKTL